MLVRSEATASHPIENQRPYGLRYSSAKRIVVGRLPYRWRCSRDFPQRRWRGVPTSFRQKLLRAVGVKGMASLRA